MKVRGGWVLEADILSFFEALDHRHLRAFLDERVRDGVLRRAIHKWLKAGVLDKGRVVRPEAGTPQGGVISPLVAMPDDRIECCGWEAQADKCSQPSRHGNDRIAATC
jgi:retron-type reverse transcriptase